MTTWAYNYPLNTKAYLGIMDVDVKDDYSRSSFYEDDDSSSNWLPSEESTMDSMYFTNTTVSQQPYQQSPQQQAPQQQQYNLTYIPRRGATFVMKKTTKTHNTNWQDEEEEDFSYDENGELMPPVTLKKGPPVVQQQVPLPPAPHPTPTTPTTTTQWGFSHHVGSVPQSFSFPYTSTDDASSSSSSSSSLFEESSDINNDYPSMFHMESDHHGMDLFDLLPLPDATFVESKGSESSTSTPIKIKLTMNEPKPRRSTRISNRCARGVNYSFVHHK